MATTIAFCTLQAQSVHYRFTGTVDSNGLEGRFAPPKSPIPGLEVNDGDPVTGSFTLVEADQFAFGRMTISDRAVKDFRVSLNGHDLLPRKAPPSDRLWINGGRGPRPQFLESTPLSNQGDAQTLTTPIGGVKLPVGGGASIQIAIVLNLTNPTGGLFENSSLPETISLDDYPLAKGFIRTIAPERKVPGTHGIMFNIDSLEEAEQPVELYTGFYVSWRADAEGLILEEAESTEGPWLPSSSARATADGMNIVAMEMQSRSKLFRLVQFTAEPDRHVFTDPKTGYLTTDIYDFNGDIIRINTRDHSMIWLQNGSSYFEGRYTVTGDQLLRDDQFFQVRFGTEGGQRKAFFTEAAKKTICDIRLVGDNLRIFATPARVPNP